MELAKQPPAPKRPRPRESWMSRQVKWVRRHPSGTLRYVLQGAFLALIIWVAYTSAVGEAAGQSGPSGTASVDAVCPFGGFETLWSWVTTGGSLLSKTHSSNLLLAVGLVLSLVLVGPAFCGWVCPFGTLQEWMWKLSRRLPFLQRHRRPIHVELPGAWERRARALRYVVLLVVLGATWYAGTLIFADYDPYRTLMKFGSDELATAGLAILGLVAAGSLVVERFWCRYLCPLGAINGLLAKLSPVRIQREPASCTNCNLCTQACYASIPVAKVDIVTDTACTGCLSCVEACPCPGTLRLDVPLFERLFGGHRRAWGEALTAVATAPQEATSRASIRPEATPAAAGPTARAKALPRWPRLVYGLAVPVVLLLTVGMSTAAGAWQTTGSREVSVDAATGAPSIDNIKGWQTPAEMSDLFGIPLEDMYKAMGFPADFSPDKPFKDLEEVMPDFSVTTLRDWVTAELAKQGKTPGVSTETSTPKTSGESKE